MIVTLHLDLQDHNIDLESSPCFPVKISFCSSTGVLINACFLRGGGEGSKGEGMKRRSKKRMSEQERGRKRQKKNNYTWE